MSQAHWHLLTYDVRDDKRRRKVALFLEGHGRRVQFSVFRIHCSPRQLLHIRWQLARRLDAVDSLLVIPLPDHVAKRIQTQSEDTDWTQDNNSTWAIVG